MVRRVNFERWYDRRKRVLPPEVLAESDLSPEEAGGVGSRKRG